MFNFWLQKRSLLRYILLPFSYIYGALVALNYKMGRHERLNIPVICVGNVTMGGSGKTPIIREIARILRDDKGMRPHILSRGYGRSTRAAMRVEAHHSAKESGDEAKMLSLNFPVWVGKDRFVTGKMAQKAGADILLMDDGLQNNSLHKDISIIAFDAGVYLGNGSVFPAGILREFASNVFKRADIFISTHAEGDKATKIPRILPDNIPHISARLSISEAIKSELAKNSDKRYVAFAGLARPEKFFNSLKSQKMNIIDYKKYPDHYQYSEEDEQELQQWAKKCKATLITSEKDKIRLSNDLQRQVFSLDMSLTIDKWDILDALITPIIKKPRQE